MKFLFVCFPGEEPPEGFPQIADRQEIRGNESDPRPTWIKGWWNRIYVSGGIKNRRSETDIARTIQSLKRMSGDLRWSDGSEIVMYMGGVAPTICPECETETICNDGGTPWCTKCGVVTSFYEERKKRESKPQTSETKTRERTEL